MRINCNCAENKASFYSLLKHDSDTVQQKLYANSSNRIPGHWDAVSVFIITFTLDCAFSSVTLKK